MIQHNHVCPYRMDTHTHMYTRVFKVLHAHGVVSTHTQRLPITCLSPAELHKRERKTAKEPEDSRLPCQEQALLYSLITLQVPVPIPSIY